MNFVQKNFRIFLSFNRFFHQNQIKVNVKLTNYDKCRFCLGSGFIKCKVCNNCDRKKYNCKYCDCGHITCIYCSFQE
jgi:hypothetical protein